MDTDRRQHGRVRCFGQALPVPGRRTNSLRAATRARAVWNFNRLGRFLVWLGRGDRDRHRAPCRRPALRWQSGFVLFLTDWANFTSRRIVCLAAVGRLKPSKLSVVAARAKGARRLCRFGVAQSLGRCGVRRAPGSADGEPAWQPLAPLRADLGWAPGPPLSFAPKGLVVLASATHGSNRGLLSVVPDGTLESVFVPETHVIPGSKDDRSPAINLDQSICTHQNAP